MVGQQTYGERLKGALALKNCMSIFITRDAAEASCSFAHRSVAHPERRLFRSVNEADEPVLRPTFIIRLWTYWIEFSPSGTHLDATLGNATAHQG